MKTEKEIISDIDLIIGRNPEVTDDTHMDLVDEISDYIIDHTTQEQGEQEKKDIVFLKQMKLHIDTLDANEHDHSQTESLKTMISDWLAELQRKQTH